MDMVERCAKAMAAKEGWRWDDERQMLDCAAAGLQNTNRERDTWRNRAAVAIGEMREPTSQMEDAVYDADLDIYFGYRVDGRPGEAKDVWRSMIDAAIKEHEEGKADG